MAVKQEVKIEWCAQLCTFRALLRARVEEADADEFIISCMAQTTFRLTSMCYTSSSNEWVRAGEHGSSLKPGVG